MLPENFMAPLYGAAGLRSLQAEPPQLRHSSMECLQSRFTWTFPEASLRIWMPAIHARMTKSAFSFSLGERRIVTYFVETLSFTSLLFYDHFTPTC